MRWPSKVSACSLVTAHTESSSFSQATVNAFLACSTSICWSWLWWINSASSKLPNSFASTCEACTYAGQVQSHFHLTLFCTCKNQVCCLRFLFLNSSYCHGYLSLPLWLSFWLAPILFCILCLVVWPREEQIPNETLSIMKTFSFFSPLTGHYLSMKWLEIT